jgi:hypothetical protein
VNGPNRSNWLGNIHTARELLNSSKIVINFGRKKGFETAVYPNICMDVLELGSCVLPGMSSSSSAGQFPGHGSLYAANNLSGLGMGSLQNLARGRPGSVGGPPGGGMPTMGGGLHSQGLQGRLTPTHFGSRSAVGGLGQGMSLLQTSSANSRNPLFSRKMG